MKRLSFKASAIAALTLAACLFAAAPSRADIIHCDDVIISCGSLCVGFDCVNGESFGFDTIRLKENNLRVHFDDTSTAASFPRNDWRITANDSTNGGLSHFSIDDATAGRAGVLRIEAGAPRSSLYVDDGGRIGLGTATPVLELHMVDGDSPSLRLEQDGSSGFTPQTWDVAGNETNFFVRDATFGSRIPFKIIPNSNTNSLVVHNNADGVGVGIGTRNPEEELEIETSETPEIQLQDTSTGGKTWVIGDAGNGTFKFSETSSGVVDFRISDQGMFRLAARDSPPTTSVGAGAMYVDSSGGGTLCFFNGAWIVVAGTGSCT